MDEDWSPDENAGVGVGVVDEEEEKLSTVPAGSMSRSLKLQSNCLSPKFTGVTRYTLS